MRRRTLLLIVLLLLGLAAGCDGNAADPTPSPTEEADVPSPSDTPERPSTPQATVAREPSGPASCVADPLFSASSDVPPVTERDNTHGPDNARITFIEYADFQ